MDLEVITHYAMPSNWPVRVRTVWLLTFPISFPLWLLMIVLFAAGFTAFAYARALISVVAMAIRQSLQD